MKLKWMTETSIKWNEKTVKAIILIPNVLYKEKKNYHFFLEWTLLHSNIRHRHSQQFSTNRNIVHDILPQNKAYIINQTFLSKIQSIAQFMAINSTHHMLALFVLRIGSITVVCRFYTSFHSSWSLPQHFENSAEFYWRK